MTEKPDLDHLAVAKALVKAVTDCGWRLDGEVDSCEWRISLVVLPPLARPNQGRNRWPDEPEEQEEPDQEERVREWAPDWDVDDLGQPVNQVLGGDDGA